MKDLASRASGLDFASVISPRRAQMSGAVAAALALGLGGYAMLAPEHFLLLAKRFANPLALIAKPSTVKLQVKPGNVTVESGGSVTVRVDVSGRRVNKAAALFTADRQPTMRFAVPASAATVPPASEAKPGVPPALQHFEIPLPGVRSNAVYFVRAGDAESPRFRIQAQRGPRLERFTLTYTYPAYTKLPPKTISAETADIAALAGTRVRVVGESSQPLSAGWLEINGTPPRTLEISDEHKVAADIAVDHDGEFKLRIADRMGFRNTDAVAYHIKALPDQPPTVKLLDPEQDLEVRANEPVNLKFAASDDYGVTSAYLVHNEHRDQMPVTGTAAFDLAKARYHVGDEVTFWIEVEDNSPAHQIAKSEARTLRISETADLSLRNKDFVELRKLREALGRANQAVVNARRGLDQLRADSAGGWNNDLAARGAAIARELEAARDASQAAQGIVAGFIAKPRSPQALRDWENLDNLLKQLDEQLAAAHDAAPELGRAETPGAAVGPALAKLAGASDRPAGLVAQLDQGFFRLYAQQQIETLTQLARRIHRAQLRVLDNVFGQSRYRRRVTDADEQADVVAAARELTAGLGLADAATADPQSAEAIRVARERLLDVSQP
ncbi:MAG: DUF4175 domain-containing protein, partial [Verrucomicrobia bacterium]|nr:DUF4175 domain-containing protein [Verrucomicrobiota bacterium]